MFLVGPFWREGSRERCFSPCRFNWGGGREGRGGRGGEGREGRGGRGGEGGEGRGGRGGEGGEGGRQVVRNCS